ncbi:MAG: DUF3500 domain-containing protein, partial [Planctomycetales bacterium]|nr:DUF3500 domain-containing protein [Planctomycetales bacterium]
MARSIQNFVEFIAWPAHFGDRHMGRPGLRFTALFAVVACFGVAWASVARAQAPATGPAKQMTVVAKEFLTSLTSELRAEVQFPFDSKLRTDWQFVPMERQGVALAKMDLEQRRAAYRLLRLALSSQGYLKATTIMSL